MSLQFDWDPEKSASNFKKHGIRFEEAAQVFNDPMHLSHQDRFENGELRWQTIGQVGGCIIVFVAHTINFENSVEIIRIISARRATRTERKHYEKSYH
ncbi:BrnT family toxin [Arsenophonus sp.]|uniref:BrnT family toxin n=1 Tax=Arsenophonus sp. TaxID=1872640 RepID=UPI00387A2E8C